MGDPVYDEQKNVIGRDFGVKNIVAIMVVGFIGYSLMGEMKPISGKGKMKGGGALKEFGPFKLICSFYSAERIGFFFLAVFCASMISALVLWGSAAFGAKNAYYTILFEAWKWFAIVCVILSILAEIGAAMADCK